MLVDIILGGKAVWRILAVLAESPGQGVTKEEIRKVTKLGGNSLFKPIQLLMKTEILNCKRFGKRRYYSINLENKYAQQIAEMIRLERKDMNNMGQAIVTLLRECLRKILDLIEVESVYVFGSVVKSSYDEKSDVDIAIVIEKSLSTKAKINLEKETEKLEERFGREIQIHFFTKEEFDKGGKLVGEVQRDGVKLL